MTVVYTGINLLRYCLYNANERIVSIPSAVLTLYTSFHPLRFKRGALQPNIPRREKYVYPVSELGWCAFL